MPELFMNLQAGLLTADPGAAGTSLASGNFAFLPVVAAPNYMRLVLNPDGIGGTAPEIVIVTAHTAAATTVTVTRGQETSFGGGAAVAHPIDTVWRHTLTRQSYLELAVPPGSVQATVRSTPDVGFAFIDGSTITGGQTLYPLTWAAIPASWKSAPNIILPDWRGGMLVCDDAGAVYTLGSVTGAMSKTIAQANLPAATITIDPPNTVVSIDPPATDVKIKAGNGASSGLSAGMLEATGANGSLSNNGQWLGTATGYGYEVNIPAFNANVDIAPFNSGNLGSGTALDVTPLSGVVNWQLKLT